MVGLFEAWSFAFFHKLSTRAHARSSPTQFPMHVALALRAMSFRPTGHKPRPSTRLKYDDTINRIRDRGPNVNHPIAIVIAGALIAAAIALTNRWTLHSQVLVRMDNWTGTTEWVNPRR